MKENKRATTADGDIDMLLQDTWLQVISLRKGAVFQDGEGRVLWDRCVANVEHIQQSLKEQGVDEVSRKDILLAQCALLDEAVKTRGTQDDACVQWYDIPLQGHFLGTIESGDTLSTRMREVLREPQPNDRVLTCFHRVMMLGLVGDFSSLNDPERSKLVKALEAKVTPFSLPQSHPVVVESPLGLGRGGWLTSWPAVIFLSVLVLVGVWWGLDSWLDRTLAALLPGIVE
ncbi:type VI secretion system protein TssL, short form [Cedecea davisae]|uniref:Type VI secretion system protein TssL, short form n=1 Tax=Cedecea davisae TaxID=158484 RepID=A0ABS6DIH9_9ENTR|nr:type VI secretion system protein TssL, short form [Cedecea davisae]MBU4682636.1 type VI secretion system protein TssL, short form [Cedecea davisae]MBU4687534.1 type VI secretion system protein TssL, short form [Cedecea davisae]